MSEKTISPLTSVWIQKSIKIFLGDGLKQKPILFRKIHRLKQEQSKKNALHLKLDHTFGSITWQTPSEVSILAKAFNKIFHAVDFPEPLGPTIIKP